MFNLQDCKPIKVPIPVGTKLFVDHCPKSQQEVEYMAHVPYANVVGSLMYTMVCTRLNIANVVGLLRRYEETPGKEHWTTIKRVFKYLHGTIDLEIFYHGNYEEVGIHGFVEFD